MTVPERARRRPWCRRRRIPIPFVTLVPEDGSPIKFKVEDRKRVKECGRKKLCQLDGEPLDPVIVFVGGETATRQRLFAQAPFHEECARYSVLACPFLRRTEDPQYMTFCRRFDMRLARFPLRHLVNAPMHQLAFFAAAIVRVEPVGPWVARDELRRARSL